MVIYFINWSFSIGSFNPFFKRNSVKISLDFSVLVELYFVHIHTSKCLVFKKALCIRNTLRVLGKYSKKLDLTQRHAAVTTFWSKEPVQGVITVSRLTWMTTEIKWSRHQSFLYKCNRSPGVHIKLKWLFYLSNTNDLSTWMINNIFYDSLKKAVIIRTDGLIKLISFKFSNFFILLNSIMHFYSHILNKRSSW